MTIAKDWLNPTNLITPHLFFRSHAAYRAACEHAMAGQIAEVFPQVRVSLEYAGYALRIHANPGLEDKWLRRHESNSAMIVVKEEFKIANVRATIQQTNQHAAIVFDQLYQRSIDSGGHPNEQAVTGSMSIKQQPNGREYSQIYLHAEGLQLEHGLKTTAQAGVCALEILREVFPARFELLGVRAKILELRRGI